MGKSPSITAGSASGNDTYTASEDQFSAGTLFFNVLVNDAKKSSLYSLDNGQVADLMTRDSVQATEQSTRGASIWITSDGRVGYSPPATQIESLAAGETFVDTFLYAVQLPSGALVWQSVQVTITGTNDAPTAAADVALVSEDALATGSVATNDRDVDHGAVLTYTMTASPPAGFSMTNSGAWAFDSSNGAWQGLAAGQSTTIVVPYSVTDQHGARANSTLTITLTGTNDIPVAASAVASVQEDGSVSGRVSATDADSGESLTYAIVGNAPAGLTFNADGTWSFDASGADYQSLGADETRTIAVNFGATDSRGAQSSSTLTITVVGTNDAPTALAAVASVAEDGVTSGQLMATDPDANSHLVFEPYYGAPDGVSISSSGHWSFDANQADYQALAAGQSRDVVVNYVISDDGGETSVSTLTVTVIGVNDAPVATSTADEVTEGGTVSGQLFALDRDDGAILSFAVDGTAPAGFSLSDDGRWTLNAADDAYRSLASGEVRMLRVSFTATDEHGASASSFLTLAVTGTNSAPELTGQPAALPAGSEDGSYTVTQAQLLSGWSDADGNALTASALSADNGVVTDNADGSFTIVPNANFNGSIQLHYEVSDGFAVTAAELALAIEPINDAPVLTAGAALPNQLEDTPFVLTQQAILNGWSDADGQSLTVTQIVFNNGSVTANPDGSYSFNPTANYNGTTSVAVTVTDGVSSQTGQMSLTVQPVNDPAVITGSKTALVIENQLANSATVISARGDLNSVDPDSAALNDKWVAVSTETASANQYGTFTISSTGFWFYTLNNANPVVDGLSNGQTLSDNFTVYTVDGTAQVVTITINGRSDFAFVSPNVTGADPNDFDGLHADGTQASAVNQTIGTPADDTFDGSDLADNFAGSVGADTLYGHAGDDYLYGGAPFPYEGVYELGADALYGQAGADRLDGGNGADTIYGGSGDDWLYGDVGANGSATPDQLYGGSGNDSLEGHGGNDVLVGGYGNDRLDGGTGADTYLFLSTNDGVDMITSFNRSEGDRIDLSAIDANINLSGDQAFGTGSVPAAYSLWMIVEGNNSLLCGDVDGNAATAEFMVQLSGTTFMAGGQTFNNIIF